MLSRPPPSLIVDRHVHRAAAADSHNAVAARIGIELRGDVAVPAATAAALEPCCPEPDTAAVNPLVFQTRYEPQILYAIVEFILIDMMDLMAGRNGTEVGLPDQYVLKAMAAVFGPSGVDSRVA